MIHVQENIPLAPYTYIKTGGRARFFVEARTEDEVREALIWAEDHHVLLLILGAGSNTLVSDNGIDGLVLRILLTDIRITDSQMYAGAGVQMAQAAAYALQHNYTGIEWAGGVPGTMGGSVYGNAGCFGSEIKDVVEHVRVLEYTVQSTQRNVHEIIEIPAADCEFAYRESVFKIRKDLIILGASLRLQKISDAEKKEKQRWMTEMMQKRIQEQAIGEKTFGSTFKGIPITDALIQSLQRHSTLFHKDSAACWVFENRAGYMSAGFLIERAGLKGKRVGDIMVSPKHANFLVNVGNASSEHVVILIGIIKEYVHRKFGIMLEEEIQYAGF